MTSKSYTGRPDRDRPAVFTVWQEFSWVVPRDPILVFELPTSLNEASGLRPETEGSASLAGYRFSNVGFRLALASEKLLQSEEIEGRNYAR